MSRKGLLLFLIAGTAWGMPYLFIRIAVEDFSTWTIVFSRVVIGAAVLIPIALNLKVLVPALKAWKYVLAYAVIEMIVPWFLITEAERVVSSGLAGLLVATVPFFGLLIGIFYQKDKSLKHPKTLAGLAVGFAGILLLVGIDAFNGHVSLPHVGMLILAAIGYAIAPVIIATKIPHISGVAVNGLAMAIVAVVYAVPALLSLPREIAANPPMESWLSLLGLGVICSAIAFVAFFRLVKQIGSARATLVTYMNMAVAVVLGIVLLGEPITVGILIGMPLVVIGSIFATRKHKSLMKAT
jgi:drug/metabolite transporter (DMT)-like permease